MANLIITIDLKDIIVTGLKTILFKYVEYQKQPSIFYNASIESAISKKSNVRWRNDNKLLICQSNIQEIESFVQSRATHSDSAKCTIEYKHLTICFLSLVFCAFEVHYCLDWFMNSPNFLCLHFLFNGKLNNIKEIYSLDQNHLARFVRKVNLL